jgi:uncharacterized membrane protein YccC
MIARDRHLDQVADAVIKADLDTLKAKKLDIAERTQRLLAQQAAADAALQSAQQVHARKREILTYCQHITAQLPTLDMPHKRVALEALDIRAWWSPGVPLRIEGSIPIGVTTSNTSYHHG